LTQTPFSVVYQENCWCIGLPELREADVLVVQLEALTADVEAVLADQTVPVSTDAAVGGREIRASK